MHYCTNNLTGASESEHNSKEKSNEDEDAQTNNSGNSQRGPSMIRL